MKLFILINTFVLLLSLFSKGEGLFISEEMPFPELNTGFLYAGEIVSINPEASTLTVEYYDYEMDTLNKIDFILDTSTKFENVSSLGEINIGDTVSIEYIKEDNKYLARQISVEKEIIEPSEP